MKINLERGQIINYIILICVSEFNVKFLQHFFKFGHFYDLKKKVKKMSLKFYRSDFCIPVEKSVSIRCWDLTWSDGRQHRDSRARSRS